MNCMTVERAVELFGERPAKIRPTSPLHSEGYGVGGLTDVRAIVGWELELKTGVDLREDLEKAMRGSHPSLRAEDVGPVIQTIASLLPSLSVYGEIDPENWASRFSKEIDEGLAALREVHEEDDDGEENAPLYAEYCEAATRLYGVAQMVVHGKVSVDDVIVLKGTDYDEAGEGGNGGEGGSVRGAYVGKVVGTGDAAQFAQRVVETAASVADVGLRAGCEGAPRVHLDGDYECGTTYG